jgi:hypothetical protein
MGLADIYSESVHSNLRMYAAWPIDTPLGLGDFGTLDGHLFQRLGNIKDQYSIQIKSLSSKSSVHYDYRSADTVETTMYAKGDMKLGGQIPLAKAGLEINFSGENAVFFDAAGCNISTIENKDNVFNEITKLYRKGKWDKKHTLITDIIRAESAMVLISKSKDASIFLEAESPEITVIELAKASIGLRCKSEKNIGLNFISTQETTPLIKLGRIKDITWPWQDPIFNQLAAKSNISEIIEMQTID